MSVYAAIDIGTNAVLLLIAEVTSSEFSVQQVETRIARLGETLSRSNRLSEAAMDRVIAILKEYQTLCAQHFVSETFLVSTSAARDAANAAHFIDRVSAETGLHLEIISGEDEARLTFLGSALNVSLPTARNLVVDIGGGSTELILGDPHTGQIEWMRSLNIGSVRLLQQLQLPAPLPDEAYQQLKTEIADHLRPLTLDVAQTSLIGVAGTVTTLAGIAESLTTEIPGRLQGYNLALERIRAINHELRQLSLAERLQRPGIFAGREDVIVVGAAVLEVLMEIFEYDAIIVSEGGLRYGLLKDRVG